MAAYCPVPEWNGLVDATHVWVDESQERQLLGRQGCKSLPSCTPSVSKHPNWPQSCVRVNHPTP